LPEQFFGTGKQSTDAIAHGLRTVLTDSALPFVPGVGISP
jgi:hypothetical protein